MAKAAKQQKSGTVMVVGGGVAGVQAALDLTELGYYVYLVEKSAAIGGAMAQLDKTFPDQRLFALNTRAQAGGGRSVSQYRDSEQRRFTVPVGQTR